MSFPTATEGSRSDAAACGTLRMFQVMPLSSETTSAWFSPQPTFGTYAVPSGPILMWPWMPPQSATVYIGTAGPNVMPPSRLSEQTASAIDCEQYQTPFG